MKVRRRKKRGEEDRKKRLGMRGKGATGSYLFKTVAEPKVKEQRHEVQRWTEGKGCEGEPGQMWVVLDFC